MKLVPIQLIAVFLITSAFCVYSETPVYRMSLKEAESRALANSPLLKKAAYDHAAAEAGASATTSRLYPQLLVDGTFRYQTDVTEISVPGRTVPMGDHSNYSAGLGLNYSLFDFGATRQLVKSARLAAQAKGKAVEVTKRQLLFSTHLTYFELQLAIEQMNLIAHSYMLAEAQRRDIRLRLQAGAASEADSVSAHKEVLGFALRLRRAQIEISAATSDLLALIGQLEEIDARSVLPEHLNIEVRRELSFPTLLVSLDSLSATQAEFEKRVNLSSPASNPQSEIYMMMANSAKHAGQSKAYDRLPQLNVFGRTSVEYPHGPETEAYNQNLLGVSVSMPIFDGFQRNSLMRQEELKALSITSEGEQFKQNLVRDWKKSRDRLDGLKAQQQIAETGVRETEKLARLKYKSYQAGRITLLEVQSANLSALEWKVQLAGLKSQLLMELAVLKNLTEGTAE